MTKITLAVRRRAHVEQRVLNLIRGGHESPSLKLAQDHFVRLRESAERCGMRIQLPTTPFVSADEIKLLGWLALSRFTRGPL